MNLSPRELYEQLRSQFLWPLQRFRDWPAPPTVDSSNAYLESLVFDGWLTAFQRDEILAGRLRQLTLGNYRLQREVEHGPQGQVFVAEHLFLPRQVIVRILNAGPSVQRAGVIRWLDQVAAVARWNHPAIVGIIDAGMVSPSGTDESPDSGHACPRLYFISPLVEGVDLRQLVWQQGPLPVGLACEILFQAASTLADAQARELAHGSFGPSSIVRTPEGKIRIVDFGLKCWPGESYPSNGAAGADAPSEPGALYGDLQGMAHCLYWALIGRELSLSNTDAPSHASLRALRPDVPAELDELLHSLLQRTRRQANSFLKVKDALLPHVPAFPLRPEESLSERSYPPTRVEPPPQTVAPPLPSLLPQDRQPPRVLIVDDEPSIRSYCRMALGRFGLHCDEAANGVLALKAFANQTYDLVLLDIDMPEMDGLQVCKQLRRLPDRPHLKIILLSGRVEADELAPMLQSGADDYLTKPFSPIQLQNRAQAALRLKQTQERTDVLTRDLLILNRRMEQHLQARDSDLVEARNALVLGLAKLAEFRDTDTGMHLNRLQVFSQRLAEEASRHPAFAGQIDRNFIDLLGCCAPLHDIGKVGLPDHILLKPGKLDDEERAQMQMHTIIGARTLGNIAEEHGFALAFLQMSIDIARHHHERFDGAGYPDNLSGTAIPLAARIVAVCDVYDAMRSRRVYKPSLPHAAVVELIRQGQGTHFDPNLVQCFEQCHLDFERLYREMAD